MQSQGVIFGGMVWDCRCAKFRCKLDLTFDFPVTLSFKILSGLYLII